MATPCWGDLGGCAVLGIGPDGVELSPVRGRITLHSSHDCHNNFVVRAVNLGAVGRHLPRRAFGLAVVAGSRTPVGLYALAGMGASASSTHQSWQ